MHLRPLGHLSRPRHASYPLTRTGLCGESGSRTHGTLADTPDFESGTFGHSVISPRRTLAASIDRVNARSRSDGVVFARFVGSCRPSELARRLAWRAATVSARGGGVPPGAACSGRPATAPRCHHALSMP